MTSYDPGTSYALSPNSSMSDCQQHPSLSTGVGAGPGPDSATAAGGDANAQQLSRVPSSFSDSSVQTSPMLSTQELLSLFECPVCYEYILPPAFQCCQGHPICQTCKRKVRVPPIDYR